MSAKLPLECYVCTARITRDEHGQVMKLLDHLGDLDMAEQTDDRIVSIDDQLGLVHCQGPPEQFDEESRVVVCRSCFDGAAKALGLTGDLPES